MTRAVLYADWDLKQEFKLLGGIEEFGYGNWSSISAKIGKPAAECKNHYDHYYVNRHQYLLPKIPLHFINPDLNKQEDLLFHDRKVPGSVYYPGTEIKGYMPRRGDFAYEPDDDAESIIADLEVDTENDDLITALNFAAIQIYQSKLKKRAFKKRIVRNYGLLDIYRQTAMDNSRLTQHQIHLKCVMRPFLRFMSPTSATKFMQSHFLEDQLYSEIKKLQEYRKNGITTFKGVKLYQRLASERKRRKVNQKNLMRKNCLAEENLLYQVLHQGSLKPKKPIIKEPKPLDVSYLAGVEKLDNEEKELCSHCRLQPEAYLQFKAQMVTECEKLGRLLLAEARKLLKIDVNKTRKLYDFLITRGLIHSESAT